MEYTEYYKDVKRTNPPGIRSVLRQLALDGLSSMNKIINPARDFQLPRVQFIYVHHVFKDEEHAFDRLLKELSRNHHFISYSEGVNRILEGNIDRPYISFSSDDGFKNNLKAAEILSSYNAPACFFINPDVVDLKQFSQIEHYCKSRLSFPPVEFMNWDDIALLQRMGHEIGSHTMGHKNVALMDVSEFEDDCGKTFDILTERCGEAKHFAFPYGRFTDFHTAGKNIVFKTGFLSCATAERGCHVNTGRPLAYSELCIRRDHVVLDWDMGHILYFLSRNAQKSKASNNYFPY